MIRSTHRTNHGPMSVSGSLALCLVVLPALWLAAGLAACASSPASVAAPDETPTPVERAADETIQAPEEPPVREAGRVIVHTTEGPVTIVFFPDVAPATSAHIMDLMQAGCYDGVPFYRLEPNFVVQTSPVANEECHADAMATVPAEFSDTPHDRLSLSLARWDDPDSGTSSWSIMLGRIPAMDGEYTVFGRVVEGEETVQAIEAIGSTKGENGMSLPNREITIERVEVVEPL